jgi:Protein of unknown function (DUF742)
MDREEPRRPGGRTGPVVRPYAITGGRASSRHADLEIETLVLTTALGQAADRDVSFEWRGIMRLCRDVQSIAEVSALLDMPLGVARVLVADMAAEGLLRVHRPSAGAGRAGLALLDRVLEGLRKL